jgi:hypothetical protein
MDWGACCFAADSEMLAPPLAQQRPAGHLAGPVFFLRPWSGRGMILRHPGRREGLGGFHGLTGEGMGQAKIQGLTGEGMGRAMPLAACTRRGGASSLADDPSIPLRPPYPRDLMDEA